jgi:CP family cyanate transporter-like MFS transporter
MTNSHHPGEPEAGVSLGRPAVTPMLIGVLAAGLNVQTAIVGTAPLLDEIRSDTGMSSVAAGLMQTMPFLCIGILAFVTPRLVMGVGPERLVSYGLTLIATGVLVRAAMPTPALILSASLIPGFGLATMTLCLPSVVKARFPRRAGAVVGSYVAALGVGSAAAALSAVPLAHAFGSWRPAVAATALPSGLALGIWLRVMRPYRRQDSRSAPAAVPVIRRRLPRPPPFGLRLAVLFACQSVVFSATISWVATLYRDRGWSAAHAGVATAAISLVTIPASLLLPGRSDGHDRRPWIAGTAITLAIGTFGLALAPTAAPWLWIAAFGAGTGAIFPLCLALPLDLGHHEHRAAELTAWMLGLGYGISAWSPTVVGGLHDITGGFTVPMSILGGVGLVAASLGLAPALKPRQSADVGGADTAA